jgi:L-threonylcarbamoyladenylate synthase
MQTSSAGGRAEAALGDPGAVAVVSHRLALAAHWLAAGGVIAYPTEAVYGLGCEPLDAQAVRRLLAAKARSEDKGLILVAADWSQLEPYVLPLDPGCMTAIRAAWPGPVTWLLPARPDTPRWLTGRHATLAVRVTAHPLAAALCRRWGGALVSTSANRAHRRPARTALAVRRALGADVDYILAGPCGGNRRPSTIRDGLTGAVLRR